MLWFITKSCLNCKSLILQVSFLLLALCGNVSMTLGSTVVNLFVAVAVTWNGRPGLCYGSCFQCFFSRKETRCQVMHLSRVKSL